jgi:hypothetical protein
VSFSCRFGLKDDGEVGARLPALKTNFAPEQSDNEGRVRFCREARCDQSNGYGHERKPIHGFGQGTLRKLS